MFSFEGEFRRRPTQALGGISRNSLGSRDELLTQKQNERKRRELQRKRETSAIRIQAAIRGFLVRRRTAAAQRQAFDAAIANGIETSAVGPLLSQLFSFYESPRDEDRFRQMSQVLLSRCQEIREIIRTDRNPSWNRRLPDVLIENLRLLSRSPGSCQSLVLPLRLVEVYAVPSPAPLWLNLVESGYFSILRDLIIGRCPEVGEDCDKAPTPLAESLVALVRKPLESCTNLDDKCRVLRSFMQSFFAEPSGSSLDCRIFHMVLPLVAALDNDALPAKALIRTAQSWSCGRDSSNIWKVHALVTLVSQRVSTLTEADVIDYLVVLQTELVNLFADGPSDQAESVPPDDEGSDSEQEMDFEVDESVMKRTATEALWALLNREDFAQKVVTAVETVRSLESLVAFSSLCYLMQARMKFSLHKCPLLRQLAFRPPFLRLLWETVASFMAANEANETRRISVLQVLSSGWRPSKQDAQSFLPLLISFCSLFGLLLPTIYETEFYHEVTADLPVESPTTEPRSSMMPFSLGELAGIAMQLRDVALGLIELSFPDSRVMASQPCSGEGSVSSHDSNPRMWLSLFQNVVQLLHQLYSRDCRKRFCDDWIVATMVLPEQVTDANLKLPYLKRRPFQHLAPVEGRRQPADDGPVPSTMELRTTAIIQELPFVVPFHTRVKIFQQLLQRDHRDEDSIHNLHLMLPSRYGGSSMHIIRRNYLYEDAFEKFGSTDGPDIRKTLRIQMTNTAGLEEAGIDGGGVFREFLAELLRTSFDINRGFFKTTSDNLFYPNPSVHLIVPNFQRHYYFIGRMLGKAIQESMLVELPLAEFFLTKLLARHNSFDLDIHHLASLDPLLYKNLLYLKSYEGDVTDLGLDFAMVSNELGEKQIVELKPDGAQIPVTRENRIEYVHLMADYKLNRQIRQQTAAFKQGLADIIEPHRLQLFDPKELQILISGVHTPINVADWRANTVYGVGYSATHPVIECFWRVVESFDDDQRKQLLKFTTSCSRPPLLGFKELQPFFCVNRVESPDRLPTSATCMNLLKLPEIDDFSVMKNKLLYAIQAGAGFELS